MGEIDEQRVRAQTKKNTHYFESEHECLGLGGASLVSLARHGTVAKAQAISPADAMFGLSNAWFVNQLKPKQRLIYTALMHRLGNKEEVSTSPTTGYPSSPSGSNLLLPKNKKEMDRSILTGSNSILQNIPRPSVHSLLHGFTYISFSESLACLMAGCVQVEPIVGRTHPFLEGRTDLKLRLNATTPRGREIQKEAETVYGREAFRDDEEIPTIILPVVLWSDAAEPAVSKQNRGSVQVYLATIGFHEDNAHSGETTVLLALGPHSAETEHVEELFCQEMTRLAQRGTGSNNLFYYGAARRVVRVFCQVYSILQDRIERQARAKVLAGNSNTTGRWAWLGNLYSVMEFFPSCSVCKEGLLVNEDRSGRRATERCCANWRMEGLTYPVPTDYPKDLVSTVPATLPFRQNTYESMGQACDVCFAKVSTGTWVTAEAKVYLKSEGVIPAYAQMVITAGQNAFLMSSVEQGSARYRELLRQSLLPNSPFPVIQPDKPWTWQLPNVSLLESIDVIMHLLFLGIVATILREAYFRWLRAKLVMTSFAKCTKNSLKGVEDMHLAWCNVQPIAASGTLSNDVSENFLAFARVGKWLFGCSSVLKPDDVTYSDPDIPTGQYNITQIRKWYKQRDMVLAAGLDHLQIKAAFLAEMTRPGGPPLIPEKGESGIPEEVLHHLMECTVSLVARVMVEGAISEADCVTVDRHAKLFLSAYEAFDKPRRERKDALPSTKNKTKATWITKMNFVSLLNLPAVMRRYGSLRALWEGDRKCEGGLPKIKAKVKGGTKGNWSGTAAAAMLSDTSLERVIKATADSVEKGSVEPSEKQLVEAARIITGEATTTKFKNFVTYRSAEAANAELISGRPVSIVVLDDGTYGMMCRNTLSFVRITIDQEKIPKLICGAAYLGFSSNAVQELIVPRWCWDKTIPEQQKILATKYGILLPELTRDDMPFTGRHHFITSNWEEMDLTGDIVRYQVSTATY
jgi:hypothetical protein